MFLIYKLCTYAKLNFFLIEEFICIEIDLALNNLQWLICHKTQPNQIIYILIYIYKDDLALNNLQ